MTFSWGGSQITRYKPVNAKLFDSNSDNIDNILSEMYGKYTLLRVTLFNILPILSYNQVNLNPCKTNYLVILFIS